MIQYITQKTDKEDDSLYYWSVTHSLSRLHKSSSPSWWPLLCNFLLIIPAQIRFLSGTFRGPNEISKRFCRRDHCHGRRDWQKVKVCLTSRAKWSLGVCCCRKGGGAETELRVEVRSYKCLMLKKPKNIKNSTTAIKRIGKKMPMYYSVDINSSVTRTTWDASHCSV